MAPGAEDVEGQGPHRRRRIGAGGKRHEALGIGLRPRCLSRSHRPAQKSLVERSGSDARRQLAPGPGQREIVDRPGRFGGDPRVGIVEESSHDVAATAPKGDHRSQTHPRRRIGGECREAHRVAHAGKPHHDRMAVMGIDRRRAVGCGSQAPRGDRIGAALPADPAEGDGRSRTDMEVVIVEQADELRPVGFIDCGTAIAELPRGDHADLPRRIAKQRGKGKDHERPELGTSCHLGEPLDGMDTGQELRLRVGCHPLERRRGAAPDKLPLGLESHAAIDMAEERRQTGCLQLLPLSPKELLNLVDQPLLQR